jgi:hypothetical protein
MSHGTFFTDTCVADPGPDDPFVPATLEGLRRCPARPEFVELHFTTPDGPWHWCFPEPPQRRGRPGGLIALTVGPYSVLARPVLEDGLGPALHPSTMLSVILGGADVVVARSLVSAGR